MIYQNFIFSGSNAGLRWLRWLLVMVGVGFLAACSDYESTGRPSGYLRVALKADTTLVMSQARSTYSGLTPYQNVADYKVDILQADTVVMRFSRYDEMPEKVELEPGRYTLKVSKGTDKAGGFDAPYFAGEQDFTVVQGEDTSVSVQAELKNGLATLNLTDDFCQTYPSYLFSLKTDEMTAPLVYDEYEYRAMYFRCAATGTKVTIGMQLTDVYGKKNEYTSSVTVRPKQWTQATVKTDGKGLHGISLEVKLDETTNQTQYINIGIPDFMQLLKGAPVVSCGPLGWNEDGTTDETVVYERQEANDLPVGILAGGKIANVRLSLKDDTGALLEGMDLANLTETQAAGLADQYGYVAPAKPLKGSLTNTINVGGFVKALRQKRDTYEAELKIEVVDALPNAHTTTKVAKVKVPMAGEPTIDWNTFPADGTSFEFGSFPLEDNPVVNIRVPAGLQSLQLLVNGEEQDIVTGPNQLTRLSDTEYTLTFDRSWLNGLRCNEDLTDKDFLLKIKLVDALERELTTNTERSFAVTTAFDWAGEVDAYARYAFFFVKTPDPAKVKFYKGGEEIADHLSLVSYSDKVAKFVWKRLNEQTDYSSVVAKYEGTLVTGGKGFTTDNSIALENGSFEDGWVAKGKTQDGEGHANTKYNVLSVTYSYTQKPWRSWERWELIGWNTLNFKTTQDGAEKESFSSLGATRPYVWTRYVANSGTIPADGRSGKCALIRTVGWGSGSTAGGDASIIKKVTPGQLFLGECIDYEPHYGIPFTARPYGLRFYYKYDAADGDRFKVVIGLGMSLEDMKVFTLADTYITRTSEWNKAEIVIDYWQLPSVNYMYVMFLSSTQAENDTNFIVHKPGSTNLTDGESYGARLYIDDVELLYDYPESE